MTQEEAGAVLAIMLTADSGCASCGFDLFTRFVNRFPNHHSLAERVWRDEYGDESFDSMVAHREAAELFRVAERRLIAAQQCLRLPKQCLRQEQT